MEEVASKGNRGEGLAWVTKEDQVSPLAFVCRICHDVWHSEVCSAVSSKDEAPYSLEVSFKNLFVINCMHSNLLVSHELQDMLHGFPHSLTDSGWYWIPAIFSPDERGMFSSCCSPCSPLPFICCACSIWFLYSGFRGGRGGGNFVSSKTFSAQDLKPV